VSKDDPLESAKAIREAMDDLAEVQEPFRQQKCNASHKVEERCRSELVAMTAVSLGLDAESGQDGVARPSPA
jgi:hypothetical protein